MYNICIYIYNYIIHLDESNIDGHYLLACCYSIKQQYESAFKQLSILFSVNEKARIENVIRLNGFLCMKINPPQYDEAILSFDLLVSKYPEDMNALLQRACCLVCLQEWDRAIDDYSLIIDFQPNLIHVICMRARTYACQRKWSFAQKDYEYVLRTYPDDEMALKGLQDLNHLYETLPMSIPDRDI
jgi:tetratricopeptide (TPR) repeat protein